MGYLLIPRNWKKVHTNPFGNDPEEEDTHDDFTVPQKAPYVTRWKHDQDARYWIRLSKAQD